MLPGIGYEDGIAYFGFVDGTEVLIALGIEFDWGPVLANEVALPGVLLVPNW